MFQSKNVSIAKRLAEAALLLAMGTVLSIFKLVDLPYGGSVTIGSMVPVLVIAYRYGTGFGLLTGFTYGIIQQLLGLKTLSYVTTWQSILAVILLDYIVAFMVIGLGGLFRRIPSQRFALLFGAILTCVLRFGCHVVSGATVWAGLSIPDEAALIYSIGYNATYMIPESIITVILTFYIGSVLDFRDETIAPFSAKKEKRLPLLKWLGGLIFMIALYIDVRHVFANIQDAETGNFDIIGLTRTDWTEVFIASAVGIGVALILFIVDEILKRKKK